MVKNKPSWTGVQRQKTGTVKKVISRPAPTFQAEQTTVSHNFTHITMPATVLTGTTTASI